MVYRKGQLSADFYVALIVFLGFLAYIAFQLFQITPVTSSNLEEENLRIESYQLSELLVNDGGYPANWETLPTPEIKRVGLSDSTNGMTNYLSQAKISRFFTLCTNFNDVKPLLDIDDSVRIILIEHKSTGDVTQTCRSSSPLGGLKSFNVSRTVFIGGTNYPTEVIVEVFE